MFKFHTCIIYFHSWELPFDHSFRKHYSLGPVELLFNGKTTSVKGLELIFDSGSSYTYLNSQAYQDIVDLVRWRHESLNNIFINSIALYGLKISILPSAVNKP